SQDKTQLVLVQVDGRSNSIGATPEEMGMIMQRCGAYEAMHLDGGGSSAIVIQNPDSGYQVVNTLSDGYQRKVINALGVFNNAPVGPAETLVIDTPEGNVFAKIPCNVSVYGLDAYYHRIDIGGGLMTLETDDPDGQWKDSTYTPGRAGTIHITARYNGLVADAALNALAIQEVASSLEIIRAMPGGAVDIRFTATGGDGEQADVTALGQYAVVPPELGTIADGKFTAMAEGAGYAACTVNGVSAYVPVYVGGRVEPAFSLGSQIETQFIGYPDSVQGAVSYDGENQAWATSYQFGMSDATQAAYFTFAEPPAVPGEPIALRLSVLGDSAGGMLRGKILDADNREHTIEFAPEMDWDGWRQVTAMIPDGVHYPIRLSRVYAAVLSLTAARGGGIHIKEAAAVYPFTQEAALPQAQRYVDPWLADLNGAPEGGAFDLEWTGAALKENQPYQFTIRESAAVLHLSGAKGGLAASNPEQWTWLAQDLSGVNASVLIVTLDRNPFDFSNPKEFELFHQALVQQKEKGKKVLVVSARGANNGGVSKDGIRYISLNADNSLLKIRVSGDAAQYQINLGA
ncbi:MAG: phosphodiester glycosidase family protein, partial [Clostridiales bacterium]|nr:phosphodiester glycosidase family protein [Clostridiales bacterium]